ncbi:TIGR03086 family protein [Micromonospora sp. KC723]|uniref:TIGR03086 family protein n=1 Tax=Micromonospora sp. KC723 TaxID=2530381 RepID=UPI001FB5EE5C|nr:TIGR03086 family protein [Micromonospora sp. KC723]
MVVNFQDLAARQAVDWSAKTDHLTPGWRDGFATEAGRLVEAWADPTAEEGVSPGMGLPQATVGLMGLSDLVLHGWDLARAVGLPYEPAPEFVAAGHRFMGETGPMGRQMGAFGPEVVTAPGCAELDRLLGRAGRDPAWGA